MMELFENFISRDEQSTSYLYYCWELMYSITLTSHCLIVVELLLLLTERWTKMAGQFRRGTTNWTLWGCM